MKWGRTRRSSTGLWHIEHNGRALCRFSSQLIALTETEPPELMRCRRCTSMPLWGK